MARLNIGRIGAYAGLGAPIKALTLTVTLYLPAFYAGADKLGLTAVGLIFLVLRIFDIAIDPLFGALADRTKARIGRRRLWIALGLPVLALSVWMVFRPALPLSPALTIFWLAAFYMAWTVVTVSHTAWASDLTADGGLLRRLIGWREWAGILGMLAIMIGPALEERHGVPLDARMATLGATLVVALVVAGVAAILLVPETTTAEAAPSLRRQLHHLVTSRPLRRVIFADLLVGCGYGAASALMLFVARSWLGVGDAFSTIMLGYFLGMLVSVPFWIRLADRIGARSTYRLAIGLSAVAQLLVIALPRQMPVPAGLLWLVQGILTGAYQFSLNSIMAETVARDQQRSGELLSGIYFALLATTNKIGYAVAIGVAYPLLDLLGFSIEATGGGSHAVILIYAVMPALCFAASAWCVGSARPREELAPAA
jgi:Na+/melibiose symporter-like transporter